MQLRRQSSEARRFAASHTPAQWLIQIGIDGATPLQRGYRSRGLLHFDMPTIFSVAGFRFMIYVHDHAPAHIHVLGQGGVVELLIDPLALRAVRGSLTNAQVRDVMRIARDRQSELLQAWKKHHG